LTRVERFKLQVPYLVTMPTYHSSRKYCIKTEKFKDEAKFRVKASKNGKKSLGRIYDKTKCPIYPKSSHNWGKFYANASNKKKPKDKTNKAS
jgi:hypothetical protein